LGGARRKHECKACWEIQGIVEELFERQKKKKKKRASKCSLSFLYPEMEGKPEDKRKIRRKWPYPW
jgi:type III secretory pathway component EscU